jgi:hypothetical protein
MVSLPANIRVNAAFPFPAQVRGSGPISIDKDSGIWTVGYDVSRFAVSTPPAAGYVLVWDSASGQFVSVPVSDLGGGTGAGTAVVYDTAHGANSLASAHVPASSNIVQTGGYATRGDGGGAFYYRVGGPAPFPTYAVTDAGGAIWQYIPEATGWNAMVAGVVADGTDDSVHMMNALLPFQNSATISNGGNLTAALILPPRSIYLHSPVIYCGTTGSSLHIVGQSVGAQAGSSTQFVWASSDNYPTMFMLYGANNSLIEEVNFNGTTGPGNLVNLLHYNSDNTYTDHITTSPVSAGTAQTFNVSSTSVVQVGAALGISPGTTRFEVVYVKAITSSTTFTADCIYSHSIGEQVGGGPPTNANKFLRCNFSIPPPFVDGKSTGFYVGNWLSATVQAADIICEDCNFIGFESSAVVSISNASPCIVTDTGHNIKVGTALKLNSNGGTLPSPLLSQEFSYHVFPLTANTYNLSTSPYNSQTDTFSSLTPNASPGVVHWAAHGLSIGTPLIFSKTTGNLPSLLSLNTVYYVSTTNFTANSFQVVSTPGSGGINFTGTQAGSHTIIGNVSPSGIINTTTNQVGNSLRQLYPYAGMRTIVGGNIKNYYLNNCQFLETQYGIGGEAFSGSCELLYPTFAGSVIADILANAPSNLHIVSAETEGHGQRFLVGTNGNNAVGATIEECSYQSGIPPDGHVIVWGGSLNLIGNKWFNFANSGPMVGLSPSVQVSDISNFFPNGPTVPSSVFSVGNYWMNGSKRFPVFYDGTGTAFKYDDTTVTRKWFVTQINDFGDGGKYPITQAHLQVTTTALNIDTLPASIAVSSLGLMSNACHLVTIPYTAINTNASTNNILVFNCPPRTKIIGVIADITQAFSGGAIATINGRLGSSITAQDLVKQFSLAATAQFGLLDADLGTSLARATRVIDDGFCGAWASYTPIYFEAISTGANLVALTQGSMNLYVSTCRFN